MRYLAALIVLVLASLVAAPSTAQTGTTRKAPWSLLGVSKNGRALKIVYEGGVCAGTDARTVARQNRRRVRIRVRQTPAPLGPQGFCIGDIEFVKDRVKLRRALRGRRITGGPRYGVKPPIKRMPRVVGLRRGDAVGVGKYLGLRVRTRGRRSGVVVRQRPRVGARLAGSDRLRLRLRKKPARRGRR